MYGSPPTWIWFLKISPISCSRLLSFLAFSSSHFTKSRRTIQWKRLWTTERPARTSYNITQILDVSKDQTGWSSHDTKETSNPERPNRTKYNTKVKGPNRIDQSRHQRDWTLERPNRTSYTTDGDPILLQQWYENENLTVQCHWSKRFVFLTLSAGKATFSFHR